MEQHIGDVCLVVYVSGYVFYSNVDVIEGCIVSHISAHIVKLVVVCFLNFCVRSIIVVFRNKD